MTGSYETNLHNDQDFSLEDNILKGSETSVDLVSLNIGEVLLDVFNKNPDHVSQIDAETNNKTTYAEMKDRSVRWAMWMEKQGLDTDDIVTLCIHNQLDDYVPVFAAYFAQAIVHPWRHDFSLDEMRSYLKLFTPKLIFADANAADVLDEAVSLENLDVKIVVFGVHPKHPSLNDIVQSQSSSDVEKYHPRAVKSPQEVAVIVSTSGSTGRPKGVMISAEAMLKNALNDKIDMRDKNVLWFVSGSLMSIGMLLRTVLKNATRIISRNTEPAEVCSAIEKFKVNYLQTNPEILNPLARFQQLNDYDMNCLEVIRTGSAKLNRVTFNKLKSSCLRDKIYIGYGITEIGITRIQPKLNRQQQSHQSIGFVSSNMQLKVIDRLTGKTLGANARGEILIKTPTVMLGYYKDPEATRKALDAEGWYHTGDVGYYDAIGEIFIMGRITDAFNYRGQEMFPGEIEDILLEHPAVIEVAVVSVPTGNSDEEIPVAFVRIRPGENVTEDEVLELFKTFEKCETSSLRVQFVNAIPLTFSRKIAKSYLKELAVKLINQH